MTTSELKITSRILSFNFIPRCSPQLSFQNVNFEFWHLTFHVASFPFDRTGGFGADIIHHSVDTFHFVDNSVGEAFQYFIG